MADTEYPIFGDEIQYMINIGTTGEASWKNITNLISFENSSDETAYEPEYIDTAKRPKYVRSRKESFEYEKDYYKGNELDEWLFTNRNKMDVPVEVVMVYPIDAKTGSAKVADKAAFTLNPNKPDNNTAGEPAKLKGTLNMSDAKWTEGSWDGKAFTADVAG